MIWLTEIQSIDPQTGELIKWSGPRIEAKSKREAQRFCECNELGYCKVIGKLHEELQLKTTEVCLN